MAKVTLVSYAAQNSVSAARYFQLGGGCLASPNVTEAAVQVKHRTPGTLTELYCNVVTNDRASSTVRTRVNGSNGGLSLTVTGSTTGVFRDTSGSDTITAGDLLAYQITPGAGGTTFTIGPLATVFEATTDTVTRLGSYEGGTIASGQWLAICGAGSDQATEAQAQTKIPASGTFCNGAVNVTVNSHNNTIVFTSRKNGAGGNISVTVTATTTGWFEDTTNSDTVVDGDNYNWLGTLNGSGSATIATLAVDFVSTNGEQIFAGNNATVNSPTPANTTEYSAIAGSTQTVSSEGPVQVGPNLAGVWDKLSVYLSSNTVSAASTIKSRINGADGNQVLNITASTSGWYRDTSNTDTIAAGDALSIIIIAGATGTELRPKQYPSRFTASGGSASLTGSSPAFTFSTPTGSLDVTKELSGSSPLFTFAAPLGTVNLIKELTGVSPKFDFLAPTGVVDLVKTLTGNSPVFNWLVDAGTLSGAVEADLVGGGTPSFTWITPTGTVTLIKDLSGASPVFIWGVPTGVLGSDLTKSALYQLWNLRARLDVKLEIDSGNIEAEAADVGGTVVTFNKAFRDVNSITVSALSSVELKVVYDFVDIPNPTFFKVLVFDTAGARVDATVSWKARGVR